MSGDLKYWLVDYIRTQGPLSIAQFMAFALHHPDGGYYTSRARLGRSGDFLTAPLASPMFGELIGLWCVQTWADMGAPNPVRLIELGPGTGVMMADMLRAARVCPDFLDAVRVSLVETSPGLAERQKRSLARAPAPPDWTTRLDAVADDAPTLIVANEFLDCLPIRQFVRVEGAWRERRVGVNPDDPERLAFIANPASIGPADLAILPQAWRGAAPDGALIEARPGVEPLLADIKHRFAQCPGRALFIDYGPAESELGDTLQAIAGHRKVDPLEAPGAADLTARVDFADLADQAKRLGLRVDGPLEQGVWLNALGLGVRAEALATAQPDQRASLRTQTARLAHSDQMGKLFKSVVLSSFDLPIAAGFAPITV